jgi:hypothetical protein
MRRDAEEDRPAVERPPPGRGLRLAGRLDLVLLEVGPGDGPQGLDDGLGLRRVARGEAVEDDRLAVLELREDRHPDRGADGPLGQRVRVVAVAAGEGDAAALPLVRPLRPGAGVARALLAEELLARAGDVGPAPRVDGADPAVGLVHQDDVVEELLVDLAAEVGRVDRLLADPLARGVEDRHAEHGSILPSRGPEGVRPCSSGGS